MCNAPGGNPDGSWKHTNALANSSSPYLLQHAHNPVDWREWGPEAFEEARRLDKPIFLSVGYSTCYWCHVMERQVFENEDIAALMNQWFVCVKVDREQRPDVDEVYMAATQLTTGHGGWPNSVFLTPSLRPFFAGTYFGPVDQHGRPGFPRVLEALHDAWTGQRPEVEQQAEEVAAIIARSLDSRESAASEAPPPGEQTIQAVVSAFKDQYDPRDGGFGLAPKFPQGFVYPLLADVGARSGDVALSAIVAHSLERMSLGGMYDQIGGGFHRYATDAKWLVPHFEKMLYDQAFLVEALVSAFRLTGEASFRRTAEDVLAFVAREMTGPEGGFYSAIDAETDSVEGKSYLWTDAQLDAALEPDQKDLFAQVYALAQPPVIPGHPHSPGGVVFMPEALERCAARMSISADSLAERLAPNRARLLTTRDARPRPLLDTKVIAAWNGMMIRAAVEAGAAFDRPDFIALARAAGNFALRSLRRDDGRLWRIWREGCAEIAAFLEDYVYLARGLLALHRAESDDRWLVEAVTLLDTADRLFWGSDGAGYYFSEADPRLPARSRSPSDGAVPSGNSAAVHAMLDLFEATGDMSRLHRADEILRAFRSTLAVAPAMTAHMVHALERRLRLRAAPTFAQPASRSAWRPGAAGSVSAFGAGQSPVRAEAFLSQSAIAPGQEILIALRLSIQPGWHVNSNPPSDQALIPTSMDVRCEIPVSSFEVRYPPPAPGDPGDSAAPTRTYVGDTVIVAALTPAADWRPEAGRLSTVPLRIVFRYQPCSGAACLAPVTRTITLEAQVARAGEPPRLLNAPIFAPAPSA